LPRRYLIVLLILTAATFSAGWAQKLPCRLHGYGPGNSYAYRNLCYSDIYVAWTSEGLSEGKRPYIDYPVEYPVLLGGLMAVASLGADNAAGFFDHTALLLLLAALAVTGTTALLLGQSRISGALLVAVAPGMVLHGTVNWDLAAAAFAGLALVAWSRRKPALAGVALGVGTAIKLYPIVFFVPLLVLCARQKQARAWIEAFTGSAVTWVLCNAVVAAMAGSFPFGQSQAPRNAVLRFFVFNRDRPADWDSAWFVVQELMRRLRQNPLWAFPAPSVNLWSSAALVMGMAAMMALLWRSEVPAELGQAVFVATTILVLTSKVFSPQYCIWLIPLAVFAGVGWAPFLGWQLLELVMVYTRFAYFAHLGDPSSGLPIRFFVAAVVARDVALIGLLYGVVRQIRQRSGDSVVAPGVMSAA
jgi:uncharacterized membrane protein